MIEQSATVSKLFAALVAAQGEFRNPPKDSVNPHFKSRFADLATVRDTVQPTLTKHGLAVSQLPCEVEGIGPGLCTMLVHVSGEYVRSTVGLRPGKLDPQGVGAALTYARRQGLQAVIGVVADDDDDGHQASRPAPLRQHAAPPPDVNRLVPVWDDPEAFFAVLERTKRKWANVVGWLNGTHGGTYKADATFFDVSEAHRRLAADAMGGK